MLGVEVIGGMCVVIDAGFGQMRHEYSGWEADYLKDLSLANLMFVCKIV